MRPYVLSALAAASLLFAGGTVNADTTNQRVPTSRADIQLTFAPLVKNAAPTVVNIYTRRRVQRRAISPFMDDPFFRQFFGNTFSFGRPRERVENSLGSGVIVRPEGLIVTNHHVIDKADEITVVLADRREFEASVVTTDERTDLAVLRIDGADVNLPSIEMRNSDELEVGDLVLAIGNPFGVGQTVTSGIVSALARTAKGISDLGFFIQTDAAINPGNSGGALISMDGRLVGINTAIYSRGGGSNGIGFAIPSNMVATVVDSAASGGVLRRPWLGAKTQTVTSDIAASIGLVRPTGVLINELYPTGPARRAGIEIGDVVTAVNGRSVDDSRAMSYRLATLRPGGNAVLTVVRRGEEYEVPLPLEQPPEDPPRDIMVLKGRHPLSGAKIANLSPALAEELSLDTMLRGVILLEILRGSPAHRVGFRPGDIVMRINDVDIIEGRQLQSIVARSERRWEMALRRGERTILFATDW